MPAGRPDEPRLKLRPGEAAVIVALLGEVGHRPTGGALGTLAARIGELLTKWAGL